MNKHFFTAGVRTLLACMVLVACGADTSEQGVQSAHLPVCSKDGSIFADIAFKDWQKTYHDGVSAAVEAHLKGIRQTTVLPLQCTAENYSDLVPASSELKKIAGYLPGYKEGNRAASLTEADIGAVLLEFLRVYECAMSEEQRYQLIRLSAGTGGVTYGELIDAQSKQNKIIEQERAVARTTLERTLTIVGGYDRLRPLSLDIECIKRASLDLRNVLGLAADASSCLPRVWDTHQSLRDLAE